MACKTFAVGASVAGFGAVDCRTGSRTQSSAGGSIAQAKERELRQTKAALYQLAVHKAQARPHNFISYLRVC